MLRYGIFGCGGFGREGIQLAKENCMAAHSVDEFELCFIEHRPKEDWINGFRVYSLQEFVELPATERFFNVLIASCVTRQAVARECEKRGMRPFTIRSRHAEVHPTAMIDEGAVLCQFTFVSANAKVGRFFHLNHHSYVAHDCVIGDYVTFAPSVRCNGAVEIGDLAYVGSGAIIHQSTPGRRVKIGAAATLGMGAVVLRGVPDGAIVVGNPARILPRK